MLTQLTNIVREASALMLTKTFTVSQKDGYANIVTSSDVAVQQFLKKRLSELLPGSGFLCEEEDRHHLGNSDTWIIDPIDGTANYARGIDQCAISVGLMHEDEITLGVVFLPRTGEMFSAEKDKGAWLNGTRIHVSERPFEDAVLCTALPVYHKEHAPECSRIISEAFSQCNDIRRFGSAATELCYVAMGRVELYFEYLLSPWDYAAASLIVTEAGGVISGLTGGKPSLTEGYGILATNNKESLDRLCKLVRSHIRNLEKQTR
jgi:myo-inositol-1(or 4)-monophosphatase